MRPLLLVSVRSAVEAAAAVRGGADIVDIKDPSRGALGCAAAGTMREICEVTSQVPGLVLLSAALGEYREWNSVADSRQQEILRFLTSPDCTIQYLKMGSAGAMGQRTGNGAELPADVVTQWNQVRARFSNRVEAADSVVSGSADGADPVPSGSRWIAVAYADHVRSSAPPPLAMARAAVSSGCAGLLLDTYVKDGTGLTHWCSTPELRELRAETHAAGIWLALAGQLTERSISAISDIRPDIIAVRGAVCEQGARGNAVSESAVRRFAERIRDVFSVPDHGA